MTNDAELKKKLVDLRATIRMEESKDGIMPFVCSDYAIDEMVRNKISTMDDICSIPWTTGEFRHQYAQRFLDVINGKAAAPEKKEDTEGTLRVLADLAKKLSNLKDSNSMLMLKGENANEYLDMSAFGLTYDQIITGDQIKLCGASTKDADMRERIDNLLSEIRNSMRDRGHNLLYLAYPFVEGKIEITDVRLRAPLALFPMIIEKSSGSYFMRLDKSRDVVINSILVMAVLDARNDISDACAPELDVELGSSFQQALADKYSEYFKLEGDIAAGDVPFDTILATEYEPEYGFRIRNSCVLGKFSNDSGTLQRDYKAIRDIGVPQIVTTLLGKELQDIYFDFDEDNLASCSDVSERSLHYISSLNASQEQILAALDKEDAFVIQGPPGTGKSEAITAIIIDSVNKGRNVLVVSEKNTALEVIKNRLGNLGKYALMINNAKDKEFFYNQIGEFWNQSATPAVGGLEERSSEIDGLIEKLSRIDRTIYQPMPGFGISAVDLYARGRIYDLSNSEDRETFNTYRGAVTDSLMAVDYETLSAVSKDMSDRNLVANTFTYLSMDGAKSAVSMIRPGLRESDLVTMIKLAEDIRGMKKGSLLFKNRDRSKAMKELCEKYLDQGADAEEFVAADLNNVIGEYRRLSTSGTVFNNYNPVQQEYTRALFKLTGGDADKVEAVNKALFECILYLHLEDFDRTNGDVIASISSYDAIVKQVDRMMSEKSEIERIAVENKFSTAIQAISGSKLRADIQNVLCNSATKYPISRFMQRFGSVLFSNIKVWLMTPDAVSDVLPLTKEPQFDLVVFDEASQMYVERGIPSICRGKKVIIAGDHKQLRPTALPGSGRIKFTEDLTDYNSEVDLALEQESLLDLARLCFQSYTLNCHYRSRYEELIQFSNSAFYHGGLVMAPNSRVPGESPIEYIEIEGMWNNQMNKKEAEEVAKLIASIVKTEGHGTIGVIAFNLKQSREIGTQLSKLRSKDQELDTLLMAEERRVDDKGSDVKIFIENIDHVQGDERDIIIFSTTYARDINGKFYQRFGWLNQAGGENRLNVAVTRAKSKVYIVTSMKPSDIDSLNDGPKVLSKYLSYARAVSDYYAGKGTKDAITEVLRSFSDKKRGRDSTVTATSSAMLDAMYDALVARGFVVDRNVGVGEKTIDLAIKGEDGYFAGIMADTNSYAERSTVRERDLHNPQYLHLRGWDIVRMWTPLYWADPAAEIERVAKAVESYKH